VGYPYPSLPLANLNQPIHPQNGRTQTQPEPSKSPVARNIMLQEGTNEDTNGNKSHNILSKQQFQASLMKLVQNETFIELVYNEYVKSLTTQ